MLIRLVWGWSDVSNLLLFCFLCSLGTLYMSYFAILNHVQEGTDHEYVFLALRGSMMDARQLTMLVQVLVGCVPNHLCRSGAWSVQRQGVVLNASGAWHWAVPHAGDHLSVLLLSGERRGTLPLKLACFEPSMTWVRGYCFPMHAAGGSHGRHEPARAPASRTQPNQPPQGEVFTSVVRRGTSRKSVGSLEQW